MLRMKYPAVPIVCCTTLLYHDISWDTSIERACRDLADDRVRHFVFGRNGKGTPGHLRIEEAQEMAEELAAYLEEWVYGGNKNGKAEE